MLAILCSLPGGLRKRQQLGQDRLVRLLPQNLLWLVDGDSILAVYTLCGAQEQCSQCAH